VRPTSLTFHHVWKIQQQKKSLSNFPLNSSALQISCSIFGFYSFAYEGRHWETYNCHYFWLQGILSPVGNNLHAFQLVGDYRLCKM